MGSLSEVYTLGHRSLSPFCSEFLEVEPSSASSSSVILSFPKDYLGNKRTSYNQRLSLNLSLPYFDKSSSTSASLSVCLEIVGQTVRYPQVRIIWSLSMENFGTKPQLIEVSTPYPEFLLPLSFKLCSLYACTGPTCVWES